MKHLLLSVFLLVSLFSFGQCPTGDIVLSSQTDVDLFALNFPNCTQLNGDLTISGDDIVDLTALTVIQSIAGTLRFEDNTSLQSFNGLGSLTSVAGLEVINNDEIENFQGLGALTGSFENGMIVNGNQNLIDFVGIGTIASVESITVDNNTSLVNFSGFAGLNNVTQFSLQDNPSLISLDGLSITSEISSLSLSGNSTLDDITALSSASFSLSSTVSISGNNSLAQCDIAPICDNLENENFLIINNASGCDSISQVTALCEGCQVGNVILNSQAEVNQFALDFPDCTQIFGDLSILSTNITDLTPLSNLTTITGELNITDNSMLQSLEALNNIVSVDALTIRNNVNLTFCNIDTVCNSISSQGSVDIADNAIGCGSVDEVESICRTGCIEHVRLLSQKDVDDFVTNFSNCSSVLSLHIEELQSNNDPITDISGLESLTEVQINVNILNLSQLETLEGLNNITELVTIQIENNESLTDLQGLSGIRSVSDLFRIESCEALTDLSPLNLLGDVSRLQIINCDNIANLDALSTNTSISTLGIVGNNSLNTIRTTNDFNIDLGVFVINNENLQNLEGLGGNTTLANVEIENNTNLQSLDGLSDLETVIEYLGVVNNNSLVDLSGLGSLESVMVNLEIRDNQNLESLEGISSTSNLNNVNITNNPNLSTCNILPICDILSGNSFGSLLIENNAPGCNSEEEIQESCTGCPFIDVTLNSQAEVDQFALDFSDCTNFNSLAMMGDDIVDISALEFITDLSFLGIDTPNLASLTGLDNISSLDYLAISSDAITNFNGLGSLTEVQELVVIGNNNLLNLSGMNEAVVIGQLQIDSNQSLLNISDTPISVSGDIFISNNEGLVNLSGLERTTTLEMASISITNNPSLENLIGLDNLEIVGRINLQQNENLINLEGIGSLTRVISDFTIGSNINLQSLEGCSNGCLVQNLNVFGNNALESIALNSTISITGDLIIFNNQILENLDGLSIAENLNKLIIERNPLLNDISVLDTLSLIGFEILIVDNNTLSQCAVEALCNSLQDATNARIENNAPGCSSVEEVQEQCTGCPVGDVTLTSQAEVDQFAIDFPDCTEIDGDLFITGDDIVDLSPLSGITSVKEGGLHILNNLLLENLSGLENLNLTNSIGINRIFIKDNAQLLNIQALSGIQFTPDANGTVALDLEVVNNPMLESLNGLEGIQGTTFSFAFINNPLIQNFQGLNNLNQPDDLFIKDMAGLTSFEGLDSLEAIGGFDIINCDALTSLSGLPSNLNVISMSVDSNEVLTSIDALANATIENGFGFTNNPNLSECNIQLICNRIADGGSITIANNAPGCNSVEEVEDECNTTLNSLIGNVMFDFNDNACDSGDFTAENILIKAENAETNFMTNTDALGNYRFFLDEGTYTVSVVQESLPDGFSTTPSTAEITFTGTGNEDMADFCLTANEVNNDLRVAIYPLEEARPGFETDYLIIYENVGTTALTGTVTMLFDDTKMNYLNASPMEDTEIDNQITWDFIDLLPFQSAEIQFTTLIFQPPTVNGNDILEYVVEIDPTAGDSTPNDNSQTFEQIVVNSFDPNDKQVTQGEEIFIEQVPDFLDYLVRFQNTGTASAVNITVTDTLVDNLDWNTLKVVSSSHDYRLEVEDNNIVKFIYEDIFLPAEQDDEPGSNGYVAFKIKPQQNLVVGDAVDNTANIFFDFNPPIITNTVRTEVVEPLGVQENVLASLIALYPNPTTGLLNVSLDASVEMTQLQIIGMDGKLLLRNTSEQIDISQLSSGIYFVRIETNRGSVVKRVVKQ